MNRIRNRHQVSCSWLEIGIFCVTLNLISYKHNDVIKWKHVLRYWSFVRGIHRSPQRASSAELWRFFDVCLNKRLNIQREAMTVVWRHCNDFSSSSCIQYRVVSDSAVRLKQLVASVTPCFNIKSTFLGIWILEKYKTVVQTCYIWNDGKSYTGDTAFYIWNGS